MSVFQITYIIIISSSSLFLHTYSDSLKHPELQPKSLSSVMEETIVNLSCSVEAPFPKQPPTISWSNIPESANITETQLVENPDKTQSVFSYMTFKAAYTDHKKNIFCTVTYPKNTSEDSTIETNVTLLVKFPPKETRITITPSASVSVGTNVNLTCRSKGSPSRNMTYTWYKRGQERPIAQGKIFTFTVTQNNTGWYSCTTQNKHGNQSAEKELTFKGHNVFSIPMIAVCIGGTVAVLMLSALVFCTRITKKTNGRVDIGGKDSIDQAQGETIVMNAIYADVLTVTNQVNDVQSVNSEHNTGKDLTEDNNEKGSDVVYAQVYNLHKKTEANSNAHEVIYSQLKI